MSIRTLAPNDRRKAIEKELGLDLSSLSIDPTKLGHAEEYNCEQMFGHVPIPVGYAGPLKVTFSSGETSDIHLPLATTEGALVASVNRGCKALTLSGGVKTTSTYHGVSRSIALKIQNSKQHTCHAEVLRSHPSRLVPLQARDSHLRMTQSGNGASKHAQKIINAIHHAQLEWKAIGEATSDHLKILKYEIDFEDPYLFLTIYADTDEAMGMNMVTIAADAIGKWLEQNIGRCVTLSGVEEQSTVDFITVAANVDSDKKPSTRTKDRGRGYEVYASATISPEVIRDVLKTTTEAMLEVAHAKLNIGSKIAGALGSNLHAANIIAALYLATGQDPAHVVEGSMADTVCRRSPIRGSQRVMVRCDPERSRGGASNPYTLLAPQGDTAALHGIEISIRLPALLVGVRGGGITLPAQSQCLNLLLKSKACPASASRARHRDEPSRRVSGLKSSQQLAESIGAAVLAGELSLLAAQSTHQLARSHKNLARKHTSTLSP